MLIGILVKKNVEWYVVSRGEGVETVKRTKTPRTSSKSHDGNGVPNILLMFLRMYTLIPFCSLFHSYNLLESGGFFFSYRSEDING